MVCSFPATRPTAALRSNDGDDGPYLAAATRTRLPAPALGHCQVTFEKRPRVWDQGPIGWMGPLGPGRKADRFAGLLVPQGDGRAWGGLIRGSFVGRRLAGFSCPPPIKLQ